MSHPSHNRMSLGGRLALGPPRPNAAAPVMTFPILATEEIVSSLSELGISITDDDLVKARPEVLKNVFDQLIILVLNVTKDELYQAKFSGLSAVDENSELHEESVHIVHWMRSINKLLFTAGMHEGYSLRDLMRPDRLKVQKALSGIINLQKFKESVQDDYDVHVRKTMGLMDEQRAMDEEIEALRLEIANVRHARDQEKPEVVALEQEIAALTARQVQLDRESATVRSAGIEQKNATTAMIDEIASLNAQISAMKGEIQVKRAQFVGSPKRIKEGLESVMRAVEAARAEATRQDDGNRALQRRIDVVLKGEKDVAKALSLLADLETDMVKNKAVSKAVRSKQIELDTATADLAQTTAQVKHTEELLRVKEAKLAELKAEYEARTGNTDKGVAALRAELAAMQHALATAVATRAEAEQKKAQLEEARDRAVVVHNSEMAEMTAKAAELQVSVAAYSGLLYKKMAEVSAAGPILPVSGASNAALRTPAMAATCVTPAAAATGL